MTKKDKFLAAAQKFLEKGSLDKALAEFQRAAQEDPKDTRTWLRIAELHTKLGASDAATSVYLKTADLYVEQGFFQRAVAVYKNLLKLSPGHVDAHMRLADIYKQLGLFSDAVQQYEAAAGSFTRAGRTKDALTALRQIVELNPDQAVARMKLAEAASQAGAVDEAVREFRRSAEQLLAQGRIDDYLRVAERILFHEPTDHALAKDIASKYVDRKNARFAVPKLQTVLQANPRDLDALELAAQAYEELGQTPKVVSTLKDLLRVRVEERRVQEGREVAARLRKLVPEDPEVRELEARLLGGTGSGSALPSVRSASALPARSPELATARPGAPAGPLDEEKLAEIERLLAEADVFAKYGLTERAADHLRKVFLRDPNHIGAHERRATLFTQLGRTAEAAVEHATLAELLARLSPEVARQHARRAVTLDPQSARAREAFVLVNGPSTPPAVAAPAPRSAAPAPRGAAPEVEHELVESVELEDLEEVDESDEVDDEDTGQTTRMPAADSGRVDTHYIAGGEDDEEETTTANARTLPKAADLDDLPPRRSDDVFDGGSLFDMVESTRSEFVPKVDFSQKNKKGVPEPASSEAETPGPRRIPASVRVQEAATRVVPYPETAGRAAQTKPSAAVPDKATPAVLPWDAGFGKDEPLTDEPPVPPVFEMDETSPTQIGTTLAPAQESDPAIAFPPLGSIAEPTPEAIAAESTPFEPSSPDLALETDATPLPGPPATEESTDEHSNDLALVGELEQVDFFLEQGMVDDARELLDAVPGEFASHPFVLDRRARLQALEVPAPAPAKAAAEPVPEDTVRHRMEEPAFAPSSDASSDASSAGAVPAAPLPPRSGRPPREAAVSPRAVVVGGGDADMTTHGDLGIAYKEMGLWDAAIQEFTLLAQAPAREVFALTMIGECHEAKGAAADAVVHYKRALNLSQITENESTQLYYMLGNVFQTLGDRNEALFFFEKVWKRDSKFRDVVRRITDLKAMPAPEGRSAAGSRKGR